MRLRPIAEGDIAELQALAQETGVGFTSLPDSEEFLRAKIDKAVAAFEARVPAEERLYFFVLEDETTGELAGCCAIEAQVGREAPFYHYRVGKLAHSSTQLDLHRTIDTLFLSADHTGDAEVASLFLRPNYRRDRNGTLLSKARWLFMAQFRDCFPNRVLAEMRGSFTEEGVSPFWECLGSHFFPIEFKRADQLTGLGQKSFIGELMPKYPIYTPFLPERARACIGQVHEQTRPALEMLKKEGLRWEGYIDIFDGGPTVEAYIDDVRAVSNSHCATVKISQSSLAYTEKPTWLAANTSMADFRCSFIGRGPKEGAKASEIQLIELSPEEAQRLNVNEGDSLRILAS